MESMKCPDVLQSFIPGGNIPPILCAISSSAFRCASFTDEVLQHFDIIFRDHFGIELQRQDLLGAVHDHGDHAAAGVALDLELGHLFLQAFLHLLRLLHHLLDVHAH
jgi:hypothetical protein